MQAAGAWRKFGLAPGGAIGYVRAMKNLFRIMPFLVLLAGGLARAAEVELQENEKQILGSWQAGKAIVEFLPGGHVNILEHGQAKVGTYEISGDWLFLRVEGEDDKSGVLLIDGEGMTVDEHEFRRVRPLEADALVGKWISERVDLTFGDDGTIKVLEKSGHEGKSGRLEIVGKTLQLTSDTGGVEVKPFELKDDTLIIDGVEKLSRVGGKGSPEMPLAGEWRHEKGAMAKISADGRIEMGAGRERSGVYFLEGAVLRAEFDGGEERAFAAAMAGNTLVLDGEVRLTKEGAEAEQIAKEGPAPTAQVVAPSTHRSPRHPVPADRFEAAVDDFLDARMSLIASSFDGLGLNHPKVQRTVREARYLLKRCGEELELLGNSSPNSAERRLALYTKAFEDELAAWGSR